MINWITEFVDKSGVRIGGDNVKLSVDNSKSASNSTIDPMYQPEDGTQLKNATAQQRQQGYSLHYLGKNYRMYRNEEEKEVTEKPKGDKSRKKTPLPARAAGIAVSVSDYMEDVESEEEESYKDKMKRKVQKAKETSKAQPGSPNYKPSNIPEKKGNDSYRDKMIDKVTKSKERIREASKAKMEEYVEDIVSKKFSKDVLDKIKSDGDIRINGVPSIDIISEENPVLVRKVKNLIDIIEKNQASGEQKGIILNYLINNIGLVDIPANYKSEILKKLR